jgi:surface antigen
VSAQVVSPYRSTMTNDDEIGFPRPNANDTELLLDWLGYLRGAVIRNAQDLSDEESRWTPDGALISVLGIINHLTNVEWRWIDGGMLGEVVTKDDSEYRPGVEVSVSDAVVRYRARGVSTDATVRSLPLALRARASRVRIFGGCCCISSTRPRATPDMPTRPVSFWMARPASNDARTPFSFPSDATGGVAALDVPSSATVAATGLG